MAIYGVPPARPRPSNSDNDYFVSSITILLTTVIFAVAITVACFALWGGGNTDPFYSDCTHRGGYVAYQDHGKTSTDLCIVNNRVVDYQGDPPEQGE